MVPGQSGYDRMRDVFFFLNLNLILVFDWSNILIAL